MAQSRSLPPYVLITPARNEEAFIEKTVESVIHQTFVPLKWVIVDDGSTDRTPEIVSRNLAQHPWIELVRRPQRPDRSFAAKVEAFNVGYQSVNGLNLRIMGHLDADLSFDPDYFEFILRKFGEDDNLGVAGTVYEANGYKVSRGGVHVEDWGAGPKVGPFVVPAASEFRPPQQGGC